MIELLELEVSHMAACVNKARAVYHLQEKDNPKSHMDHVWCRHPLFQIWKYIIMFFSLHK